MSSTRSLDALIVGAGFGGLYQLHQLRKHGHNCKVVDIAGGIGGTWYWNCYPGARVDTHVPIYEFGVEGLYKDFTWTERFPSRPEIMKYFRYVDEKLDLSKDVYLNTGLKHAHFDTKASRWVVSLTTGEIWDCKYLILCTGSTSKRYIPDFKGMETYTGAIHHTGCWPQEGVDTAGKKVAIIGTGASGVQTIQEVGPKAAHLAVFQRTPNICLPMRQANLTEELQNTLKKEGTYEDIYKVRPKMFSGFDYGFIEKDFASETPEQRRETLEKLWNMGGFRYWLGNYMQMLFSKEVNDFIYTFWAEKTRPRVKDPKKRDLLAPRLEDAYHTYGTKRPSLEQNFFEVCNQENVDIINVNDNAIEHFTATGIRMSNGDEYELDVVILATGYDAISGPAAAIDIVGTTGQNIASYWSDGVKTYLGMTISTFPNLFMTYGPQAPTGFANGVTMAELQGDYVTHIIEHLTRHNISTIEPSASAEKEWTRHIVDLAAPTLIMDTKSWYTGANIPGKKIELNLYVGGVPSYMNELESVRENEWKGFVLSEYKGGE